MDNPLSTLVAQSERLQLRLALPADLDFILESQIDADNSRYIGGGTRQQHLDGLARADSLYLVLQTPADTRRLGYIIINGLKNSNDSVELMLIVVTDKGKGYGRAALQLIKRLAFEEWGAHRLWLDVKDYTIRARRLYEAEGFVVEGTLREALKVGDIYESLVLMSVLHHEYEAGR